MRDNLYKFIDKNKIEPLGLFARALYYSYRYANEPDFIKEYKELVIEEKPEYDEETQELYSWYEDGEVITQKFKIIEKTAKNQGI
jgi:hypothetical protein